VVFRPLPSLLSSCGCYYCGWRFQCRGVHTAVFHVVFTKSRAGIKTRPYIQRVQIRSGSLRVLHQTTKILISHSFFSHSKILMGGSTDASPAPSSLSHTSDERILQAGPPSSLSHTSEERILRHVVHHIVLEDYGTTLWHKSVATKPFHLSL
jgi:hypothetical protein